jgi:glycogen operon protein
VNLIAEPWDLGEGGYQVGNFPVGWAEWNDRYRDTVRAYWRGDEARLGELAFRITGSSDLYGHSGRLPYASVNFVTAHDGFTLQDLVSYDHKHNEANGEENRDGTDHNLSWNCGVEGPTDDPEVLALRARQKRNFLVTLLLSQGVPMMLAGDAMGRTQHGNNNAYCQDNELSWVDWEPHETRRRLVDFTRRVIALRMAHPVFRRRRFFQGRSIRGAGLKDLQWLNPEGREMTEEEWNMPFARCVGLLLAGEALADHDARGRLLRDDNFLWLLNAHHEEVPFVLPGESPSRRWAVLFDTSHEDGLRPGGLLHAGDRYPLEGRSTALLVDLGHPAP